MDSDNDSRPGDGIVEPLFEALTSPEEKLPILVHDGACPWCRAYVGRLIARGHLPPEQSRDWQGLQGADREAAWAAGIGQGMVAFIPGTDESRFGAKALLWVLANPGPLRFPFRAMVWPAMGPFVSLGYRLVVWLRKKRFPGLPTEL